MKVALILEGGGMRGLYTAGVLDFFLTKNITFDMVAGVSAGACNACSYLSKQPGRGAAVILDYIKEKEYMSFSNLVKEGSFFGMDLIFNKIPNHLNPYDYKTANTNPTAFYCVCTNVESGKPYYRRVINYRSDMDYIKASMSLPLLSTILDIDGHKLLDGGVSDSIPIQFADDKGYEKQVVVLTQCRDYRKGKNRLLPIIRRTYKEYPNLVKTLENRHIEYNKTLDYMYEKEKRKDCFIIQPKKAVNISRLEKSKEKLHNLYLEGYRDAQESYEELLQFLNKEKHE